MHVILELLEKSRHLFSHRGGCPTEDPKNGTCAGYCLKDLNWIMILRLSLERNCFSDIYLRFMKNCAGISKNTPLTEQREVSFPYPFNFSFLSPVL